jgi:hypothetical protein
MAEPSSLRAGRRGEKPFGYAADKPARSKRLRALAAIAPMAFSLSASIESFVRVGPPL